MINPTGHKLVLCSKEAARSGGGVDVSPSEAEELVSGGCDLPFRLQQQAFQES